jgi:hypothetical protein
MHAYSTTAERDKTMLYRKMRRAFKRFYGFDDFQHIPCLNFLIIKLNINEVG